MAPSSAARTTVPRRPPVPAPSVAPAGEFLGTGVERERRRGRGAVSNASGRYEPIARIAFDDGWRSIEELPPFATTVTEEKPRKIVTRNESPDISFDRSINPYRGCEHGCVYCFARPTHAYMGLSAGLDFESKLFAKPEAPALLERELSSPGYEPRVIAMGTNTDPYQPIERRYETTRRILEVLDRAGHPVGIVTKSVLILRDLDILSRMARRNLVKVALSVTTLDGKLARTMEPRAATPARRLDALRRLADAGVPTTVMVAPVIPPLNDHREMATGTRAFLQTGGQPLSASVQARAGLRDLGVIDNAAVVRVEAAPRMRWGNCASSAAATTRAIRRATASSSAGHRPALQALPRPVSATAFGSLTNSPSVAVACCRA
ncbi:MAG: PA0069 family radical SAM protein [Xanthobacteraceae bacterium]|nr:PA0069 family radical SAM protein [Xanthobacteraceae bacterium]